MIRKAYRIEQPGPFEAPAGQVDAATRFTGVRLLDDFQHGPLFDLGGSST